jgi:hypothetical protein
MAVKDDPPLELSTTKASSGVNLGSVRYALGINLVLALWLGSSFGTYFPDRRS